MKRNHILAHRGLWSRPEERNTPEALFAALNRGFGIETDFRDRAEVLLVSHDPPSGGYILTAAELFDEYVRSGSRGRLALNVKADGLQQMLQTTLSAIPGDRYYAFDMSIPDALGYIRQNIPVYSRISEYEADPAFAEAAAGVWIDNFSGEYPQIKAAERLLQSDKQVALVSPELHGRSPETFWEEVWAARLHTHPKVEICTDFPERVFEILGTE